ncbi:uncharacterized protein LOC129181507 [Dunckerocampus dactyliophorus]|uniref:uncharacterized protein LOC129181507 n=1 Tax=Dunckerocampus dactyliophorus TaxID=161453 RepID=UPI0024050E98|nr:uncharacterized protein LOC129181507 [Dunckerocampus dactyliophorus]
MEDIHNLVFFLFAMWLYITRRRQALFERRLQAARRNTVEKMRRVWELMEEDTFPRRRRRRRQRMLHVLLKRRRRPSIWAVSRSNEWWDEVVPGFTRTEWVHHFRMSEETFLDMCGKLRPAMEKRDTNFRVCVPVKKRVAIALWKLATNSEYRSISHLFGVSKTTVCRCVREFCLAVCTLLVPQEIRFPDVDKLQEMAAGIEQSWGLPQCIGAIDGAHIPIIAPHEKHRDYINGRGWHSIILQGVVDRQGWFWSACAGMAGSLHDAQALRMSSLWQTAEEGRVFSTRTRNIAGVNAGYYILGDAGYPSKTWLLKPFPDDGQLTAEQQTYNETFRKARMMVTGAFSRLRGRWRCLTKRNDSDIEVVKSMVLTCCALHNLCERRGEEYRQEWDAVVAAPTPAVTPGQDGDEEEGEDVRGALMIFFNNLSL